MLGFQGIVEIISKDLEKRLPKQRATQRRKLSELVGGILICQTPNLMELSNVLDRPTQSAEARYNYVERFLKNPLVHTNTVMAAYAEDLLFRLAKHQHTLVLMIDQSKVNGSLEVLMVSVRLRKRAVPLFWIVRETKGGIGFSVQKTLLEVVRSWIPEGCRVMLAGDRFYGTAELVGWCQEQEWGYRLRLKGNLCIYQDQGPDKTLDQLKAERKKGLEKARFRSGMVTSVGILHDPGHAEPWYIAMNTSPNEYKTLDYGLRWGIESMFSDFKSRGFSLMQTHIRFADRLERLLLVLSIALHWAVAMGLWHEKQHQDHAEKRGPKKPLDRSSLSLKEGYAFFEDAFFFLKSQSLYGFI
ncbi:MAG: IS4 family transposase [Alphaproteobacteria bacterium]|nr:IS4 family transposase [Alphaproteobacteria bacterium]